MTEGGGRSNAPSLAMRARHVTLVRTSGHHCLVQRYARSGGRRAENGGEPLSHQRSRYLFQGHDARFGAARYAHEADAFHVVAAPVKHGCLKCALPICKPPEDLAHWLLGCLRRSTELDMSPREARPDDSCASPINGAGCLCGASKTGRATLLEVACVALPGQACHPHTSTYT